MSGASAGTTARSMNLTAFGPGRAAKDHYHRDFETAIYGVTGKIALFFGKDLDKRRL